MSASKVNKDLQEERDRVSFKVKELTNWFYSGAKNVAEKNFIENILLNDTEMLNGVDTSYLSYKEKYEEAIRRHTLLLTKIKQLELKGRDNGDNFTTVYINHHLSILREGSPSGVHFIMFVPALKSFGTPEQQAEWLPKAEKLQILGTYAQTELGHGTFIRGLETTAIYDQRNRQFVINSPTITAYKWWPGGLGHTVNHAIILAQLYTKSKCHGLHPFIVQLRDTETHMPMKGITIGDIGNKVGANTANNGFLGFHHVRVPLNQMLMANAKVLPSGDYIKGKSSLLTYGTMTLTRVGIVRELVPGLCKAATIATRYSIVRRQSPLEPNQPEPKIIDHVTQQMKIFPVIVKAFAVRTSALSLEKIFLEVNKDLVKGDLSRLPELHALSCCLKAVLSDEATRAVEVCRLACGGHGYLNASGINEIYTGITAAQTYEGENTVLLLQTGRFLVKSWRQAVAGQKLSPSVEYFNLFLKRKDEQNIFDDSYLGVLRAIQFTAAGNTALAFQHIEERKKFCSPEEAANQTGIELVKAAELHCQVFILESLMREFQGNVNEVSSSLNSVFHQLLELHVVDLALKKIGSLLQFVDITAADIEKLQSRLEKTLKSLRPNAIGIVDAFDIPDKTLGSTLGAYDGNVYERLLAAAKASPLNQEEVNKSFELYLKPFMKSSL